MPEPIAVAEHAALLDNQYVFRTVKTYNPELDKYALFRLGWRGSGLPTDDFSSLASPPQSDRLRFCPSASRIAGYISGPIWLTIESDCRSGETLAGQRTRP